MKTIDMRFDENICREMIGEKFDKYRCDRFDFTNSVTQLVGVYVGDCIYALTNIQEPVDYFGNQDDIGVFKISKVDDTRIKSAFQDQEQINTPVMDCIKGIHLVNDHQQIFRNGTLEYDVWLTRAIIFVFEERQIIFEKDSVPFSEEIIIRRGQALADTVASETEFLDGWDNSVTPKCIREIIKIM